MLKVCHICEREFCFDENEKTKFKLYQKVRDPREAAL